MTPSAGQQRRSVVRFADGDLRRDAVASIVALAAIAGIAVIIQGWRVLGPPWLLGDAQYHAAMAAQVGRGRILPEGYYVGVPSWYTPAFAWLLGVVASLPRLDPYSATRLLSVLAIPLLPIATYYLATGLGLTRSERLIAAVLVTFGGGLTHATNRLWVFSFFAGGHNFYPLYPRDIALALVPIVLLWISRASTGSRGWAAAAGVVGGIAFLFQPQPVLPAILAAAIWGLWLLRIRSRRIATITALGLACVAFALTCGWWVARTALVAAESSLSVSSPFFTAPTLPLTAYPLEFGVMLPLGIAGAVIAWRSGREDRRLLTLAFGVPFLIGFAYRTGEPLGDYLGSDRMWLAASIPMAVLAAIAVPAAARLAGRLVPSRRTIGAASTAVALVGVAIVPATAANFRRVENVLQSASIGPFDARPTTDLVRLIRHVTETSGAVAPVLGGPEASLNAWFNDGRQVVYLYAPGWSKIGFDPGPLTGATDAQRAAAEATAFSGSLSGLMREASAYGAAPVVLERRGAALATLDLQPGLTVAIDDPRAVLENGWSEIKLTSGESFDVPAVFDVAGPATLRLTVRTPTSVSFSAGGGVARSIGATTWSTVDLAIQVTAGDQPLHVTADGDCEIARVQVFAPVDLAGAGWTITATEGDWVAMDSR